MKRKNLLAVIALVAVFALALAGCGSDDKDATDAAPSVPEMSAGQELTLTDTVCHANRKNGADVSGTSVNLSSARFYENGENGIAVQKADGVCIVSCGAEKNGAYGIFLQGEKERLCRGVNVEGCSFRQNGAAHLFADCVCALCACHNLFSPAEENPPYALVLCRLRDAAVRCNLLTKSYALAPIENADNHRGQIALSQNIG